MMNITDNAVLSGVSETPEGYLEAAVRISRTGIQDYYGAELGRPDLGLIKVYRGEDAVFDRATLDSFAHIPLTVDHPTTAVDSKNWKKLAVGTTGGEVLRDGEFLKIGIKITDADAIAAVRDGKRELSVGYQAMLDWTPGVTPEGQAYDCRQVKVVANHLAIVSAGRAGSLARIGDNWGAAPHTKENTMTMKIVVLGDTAVQVAAEDASKVEDFKSKIVKDAESKSNEKDKEIEALNKKLAERDAEIGELKKSQVKDSDLDRMVADRATLIGDARKVIKDFDGAGKSDAAIRREVVAASGQFDVNDSTDPAYINAAFDLLKAGKVSTTTNDGVRSALLDSKPASGDDASWSRALDSLPGSIKKEA